MSLTRTTLEKISAQFKEPEWLLNRRVEAFEVFSKLPLPSLKYGIRMHINLSALDLSSLNPLDLSSPIIKAPSEIEVLSFPDAVQKHGSLLQEYLMSSIPSHENKLTALHAAFMNQCIVMHIPRGVKVATPIEIVIPHTSSLLCHVLVIADEDSSVTIMEHLQEGLTKSVLTHMVEVFVKDRAFVEYRSLQESSLSNHVFSRKHATVSSSGTMKWLDASLGGVFTQSLVTSALIKENASSEYLGLVYGTNDQVVDIFASSEHHAPHTRSVLSSKIVLDDTSRVLSRGLIKMVPAAHHANGFQHQDIVLLSDQAHADAVPFLEIENNDITCKHGATISQIDAEKLFYMMSRGLSEYEAKRKIIEGFFMPILVNLPEGVLHTTIEKALEKRLVEVTL